MTIDLTNQQKAQVAAVERAVESLAQSDLSARCAALGLPVPEADGTLRFRFFDQMICLSPPSFAATFAGGKPAPLPDRLLALHYLLCEKPAAATGELITFRDLPGGSFYFGPFSNRTTRLLTKRIGANLALLRQNLGRFDHAVLADFPADLAACIQVLGHVHVTLLYHLPDEESPATAELLFDASIKHHFNTEDVAVLGSRLCLLLIQQPQHVVPA